MRSAAANQLPTIAVGGVWFHAYTIGRAGSPLRITPGGTILASGLMPTRFNPGRLAMPSFETLYLALDPTTAFFEKRVYFGNPYGSPEAVVRDPSRTGTTGIVRVEVGLARVVDLTDEAIQRQLETSAQELTGDWEGYAYRHAMTPVAGPTGVAPTQQLALDLFRASGIQGIVSISARVPTTKSLVVFTHKLTQPGSLRWMDPTTRQSQSYP